MVINKDTKNLQDYKIHAENGEQIFGLQSFDTETCEADMMMLTEARTLDIALPDGSRQHKVQGSGLTVKRVKLDGAYATFRGKRV